MIKNALKNFFKNIMYVFVPMGIVYLVFLIAVFVLVGGLVQYAGTMLGSLSELIKTSAEASSASVNAFFAYSAEQLTKAWNGNLWSFFRTIFETRWLQNTVVGFFNTLSQSTEGFEEQIAEIIGTFKTQTVALLSSTVVLCIVGVVLANFITGVAIRQRSARRNLKGFLLAHTVVPVVEALLLVGAGVLFAFIRYYTLLVIPVFVLIAAAISLTSSWIVHRDASLPRKEVVTVKNILIHLAAVGLILLINIVLAAALFFVNKLFAILIMIPVILYSLNIADVNPDIMVRALVEQRKKPAAEAEGTQLSAVGEGDAVAPTSVAEGGAAVASAEITEGDAAAEIAATISPDQPSSPAAVQIPDQPNPSTGQIPNQPAK